MSKVKIISDVVFSQIVKQKSTAVKAAATLIAVPGTDDAETFKTYSDLEEVAADFDEDTAAYKQAEQYFAVMAAGDHIGETVAIGTYSTKDLPDPMVPVSEAKPSDVNASATGDGAVVSSDAPAATVTGIVHLLTDYFTKGWRFIIAPGADITTLESVMDFVYENQHGILVVESADVATVTLLNTFAAKYTDPNKFLPVYVIPVKSDLPVGVSVEAEAATEFPIDWQHIGKLPNIVADDWTMPEITQFDALNASPVVDKAGDLMMLHGRALDGHYMDNVFCAQYVKDYVTAGMQNFLDAPSSKFLKYNNAGIALIKAQLESLMTALGQLGFFGENDAGKPDYTVSVPDRDAIPDKTVEGRKLNVVVNYTMASLIDYIDGQLNLTI